MTVASTLSKVTLSGNGATRAWPFSFPVKDASHLRVVITDPVGAQTTLSSGYTVALTGSGGTVTYPTSGSPLAAGYKITLRRVVPLTQSTALANQDGFYAEVHEDRFDLLAMADQQQQEQIDRAIKTPDTDTVPFELPTQEARATRIMGFDASGKAVAANTTVEALDALTLQALQSGKVAEALTPFVSDGVQTVIPTTVPLMAQGQVTLLVGGVLQAPNSGAYTVARTETGGSITLAAPAPAGVTVGGYIGFAREVTGEVPLANVVGLSAQLAGKLAANGDGSNVVVTATGGTTEQAQKDRAAAEYAPEDFGAAGNGVSDDAAAFSAAFAAFGAAGGTLRLRREKAYRLNSTITIPTGCRLAGHRRGSGFDGGSVSQADLDSLGSRLVLGSGASIRVGSSAAVEGLVLQRAGLTIPADPAGFTGTAIQVRGHDAYLGDLTILGFAQAVDAADATYRSARLRAERVQFDCASGFLLDCIYDVPYLTACHGISMLGSASAIRSGSAFDVRDVDGARITDCFSYGYQTGFDINGADTATLIACGADHASGAEGTSIGFHLRGATKNAIIVGGWTVNKNFGYKIEPTAGNNAVVEISGSYAAACTGWNYDVQSGRCHIHGCKSYGGNNGVRVSGTADYSQVSNTHVYNAGTEGFYVNPSLTGVTYFGNTFKSNSSVTMGERLTSLGDYDIVAGDDVNLTAADTATVTTGGSLRVVTDSSGRTMHGSAVSAGPVTSRLQVHGTDTAGASLQLARWTVDTGGPLLLSMKSRGGTVGTQGLVSGGDEIGRWLAYGSDGSAGVYGAHIKMVAEGTPASGAVNMNIRFGTGSGSPTTVSDRWRIESAGHLRPEADNTYTIGNASYRVKELFAATATVNTSDAALKLVRGPLTEAEMRVSQRLAAMVAVFQMRDAVAAKGGSARLHVGWIAQEVAAAFEAEGLDASRYALWCADPVMIEIEEAVEVQVQATEPRTVTVQDVEIRDGEAVMVARDEIRDEPVWIEYPVVDDTGAPVVKAGAQLVHRAPKLVTTTERRSRSVPLLDDQGQPVMRLGLRYEQLQAFVLAGLAQLAALRPAAE